MKLYFLRHGIADWPNWRGSDDDRPLTDEGKIEMQAVAEAMRKARVAPDCIVTSPLPRAAQTAAIVGEQLGIPIEEDVRVLVGFNGRCVLEILKTHPKLSLMFVGHEPTLSAVIEAFTGARVHFAKGGLARLELDDETAVLEWMLSPRLIRRLSKG